MANTKISALSSGNPAQSTDIIPIDRSGSNFGITAASIAALAPTPAPNFAQTFKRMAFGSPTGGSSGTSISAGGAGNVYGDLLSGVGTPYNQTTVPTANHGPTTDFSNASGDTEMGLYGENMWLSGKNLNFQSGVILYRATDIRIWLGYFDTVSTLTISDTAPSSNYVAFRLSNVSGGVGDTHWQCCSRDGTTQTVVATTIVPDTNQHAFGIKCDDANSQYLFYIDGVLVGTINTHLMTINTATRSCVQASWHTASLAPLIGIAYVGMQADW